MPLKLSENRETPLVGIPAVFLETFLPKAPPAYTTAYLYAYACCIQGKEDLTTHSLAERLNFLESDLLLAWKYWQDQGLISYDKKTETISFLDLPEQPQKSVQEKTAIPATRPVYTPEEISIYTKKSNEARALFASAQSHLNKLLTYQDMNTLFGFYDWLGLPMDVIEILLAYCAQNNHRSLYYIEKVALDWAERGINTSAKAMERIKLYQNQYRQVLKAFGQENRMVTPVEETYLKRWFEEFKMPLEVVLSACEKTLLNTGKPSYQYTDRILSNWHHQNAHSIEEVQQLQEEFQSAKKDKTVKQKNVIPPRKNRFINYEQRKWDFESLEKMEKEYLKKNLEE